jgi:hypothetical protein
MNTQKSPFGSTYALIGAPKGKHNQRLCLFFYVAQKSTTQVVLFVFYEIQ